MASYDVDAAMARCARWSERQRENKQRREGTMNAETWNTGAAVSIRISPEDYEHLSVVSSVQPHRLEQYPDRFRDPARGGFVPAAELEQWRYASWYDRYSDLLLARAFLAAIGEPFLVASDEYVEEAPEAHGIIHHVHGANWVIFTDYASPTWTKRLAAEEPNP